MTSLLRSAATVLLLGTMGTAAFAAGEPAPLQLDAVGTEKTATNALVDNGAALRKITADQYDLFLSGEYTSRSLPFYALPDEASTPAKLVLWTQTAISVAPEQSKMIVKVNGTDIGTVDLVAGPARRIVLDVPSGVINPGYNAVTLGADQRHRVDCSMNATYELWTKIDPDRSGFVYAAPVRSNLSLLDLLPLAGTRDGRTAIRVVLPADASMKTYDRAMSVVQALSIMGSFTHPTVEFANQGGKGPGLDIYIGTKAELVPLLGRDHRALASGDNVVVNLNRDENRAELVMTGADANELDLRAQEMASMASRERPVGTGEGLKALTNLRGRTLVPGQNVKLADLGYNGKPFSGRLSVTQLNFTMPSDFYPGDYASMSFHLNALYAGGLSPDAVLAIKANDVVVANISLSSTREGQIKDQRLPIPFSALRPGQNTLKIEARLPSRADQACESVDSASASARLFIDENSYFEVPSYARIGRSPDIAALTSGLTQAQAGGNNRTEIFVPGYNKVALNSAATFLAKMAYSSQKVQPVEFTSTLPDLDSQNVIAFGSFDTLPSELTTRMKLDFVNIRKAAAPTSLEVTSLDDSAFANLDLARIADPAQKPKTLTEQARAFIDNPRKEGMKIIARAEDAAVSHMHRLNLKYLPSLIDNGRTASFSPTSDAAVVVAQQGSKTGGSWTVVAAKNMDMLASQTDVLTDYNVWNRLGGSVQSMALNGETIDRQASDNVELFQTQPFSIVNARLIAAGWLANNSELYVGALLVAAIMLGLGTYLVLRTSRSHHG